MNLVRLYYSHGPVWIDTDQLSAWRTHLTIYTKTGLRVRDTARTKQARENASYGVHRDNLFASPELAEANSARFWLICTLTHQLLKGELHHE